MYYSYIVIILSVISSIDAMDPNAGEHTVRSKKNKGTNSPTHHQGDHSGAGHYHSSSGGSSSTASSSQSHPGTSTTRPLPIFQPRPLPTSAPLRSILPKLSHLNPSTYVPFKRASPQVSSRMSIYARHPSYSSILSSTISTQATRVSQQPSVRPQVRTRTRARGRQSSSNSGQKSTAGQTGQKNQPHKQNTNDHNKGNDRQKKDGQGVGGSGGNGGNGGGRDGRGDARDNRNKRDDNNQQEQEEQQEQDQSQSYHISLQQISTDYEELQRIREQRQRYIPRTTRQPNTQPIQQEKSQKPNKSPLVSQSRQSYDSQYSGIQTDDSGNENSKKKNNAYDQQGGLSSGLQRNPFYSSGQERQMMQAVARRPNNRKKMTRIRRRDTDSQGQGQLGGRQPSLSRTTRAGSDASGDQFKYDTQSKLPQTRGTSRPGQRGIRRQNVPRGQAVQGGSTVQGQKLPPQQSQYQTVTSSENQFSGLTTDDQQGSNRKKKEKKKRKKVKHIAEQPTQMSRLNRKRQTILRRQTVQLFSPSQAMRKLYEFHGYEDEVAQDRATSDDTQDQQGKQRGKTSKSNKKYFIPQGGLSGTVKVIMMSDSQGQMQVVTETTLAPQQRQRYSPLFKRYIPMEDFRAPQSQSQKPNKQQRDQLRSMGFPITQSQPQPMAGVQLQQELTQGQKKQFEVRRSQLPQSVKNSGFSFNLGMLQNLGAGAQGQQKVVRPKVRKQNSDQQGRNTQSGRYSPKSSSVDPQFDFRRRSQQRYHYGNRSPIDRSAYVYQGEMEESSSRLGGQYGQQLGATASTSSYRRPVWEDTSDSQAQQDTRGGGERYQGRQHSGRGHSQPHQPRHNPPLYIPPIYMSQQQQLQQALLRSLADTGQGATDVSHSTSTAEQSYDLFSDDQGGAAAASTSTSYSNRGSTYTAYLPRQAQQTVPRYLTHSPQSSRSRPKDYKTDYTTGEQSGQQDLRYARQARAMGTNSLRAAGSRQAGNAQHRQQHTSTQQKKHQDDKKP